MSLFNVVNDQAQFDAASNVSSDVHGAGIRFTQAGAARVTTTAGTFFNQGIPMSDSGQVAIVDATAGLPADTTYLNGLPISGNKVCVSRNASSVVSNGLPFDSNGAIAGAINFDLNFIGTDTLDPQVTFTRASTATRFDQNGVLQTVASGVARSNNNQDYDPVTLAPRGFLVEEQRTNLLTYSAQFDNAAWQKINSTINANVGVSPDGTANADKLEETAVTNFFAVVQNPTAAFSTTYTWSCFAKAAERNQITVNFSAITNVAAIFNLVTGAVVTQGAGITSASGTSVGNGWFRFSITFTTPSSGLNLLYHVVGPSVNGNPTYAGVAGFGILIWGAQLEAGAFPTSYIPTTTTALTRAADVASVNTLSPWYNSVEGTLYGEFAVAGYAPTSSFSIPAVLSDNTNNNVISVANTNTGANLYSYGEINTGGVSQAGFYGASGLSFGVGSVRKSAIAYAANNFAFTTQGAAVQTDTSGTVPTVSRLYVGVGATGGSLFLNGYLRRVSYYPTRLSNAQLQAITA